MSETTIATAAREYARRPKDERFASVEALITAAQADKDNSLERTYNLRDLRAVPVDGAVRLASPKADAALTHWSFGQLSRLVGAPAGYLRELPATLAADCLNHGISEMPHGHQANLLLKGTPQGLTLRACLSDQYGRLWDATLYRNLADRLTKYDSKWTTPPTWSGEPAGAYRGDRDSFVILTNGGSIVEDPSARNNRGEMYRGLLIRNSEVGAAALVIEQILFRFVCGNHMLWGAVIDRKYRRRHVGNMDQAAIREISRIAWNWTEQSTARDNALIAGLIAREIAQTKDAVLDELQSYGATKDQAAQAYDRAEQTESAGPRSFWGIANGLTRISQDSGYQDDRYILDKLAAAVLARGAKLVAA